MEGSGFGTYSRGGVAITTTLIRQPSPWVSQRWSTPAYDHAVARSESVRAVIEDNIDTSVQDDVEIQAIGVMDLCCHVRRELDKGPLCDAGRGVAAKKIASSRRSARRRGRLTGGRKRHFYTG